MLHTNSEVHSDIHLCTAPCVLFDLHFLPYAETLSNSQLSVWVILQTIPEIQHPNETL